MGSKLISTLICIAIIFLALALMRRGWLNRKREQSDWGTLQGVPHKYDELIPRGIYPGIYVTTTVAGDWLDRVSVNSLGVKAKSRLLVFDDGLIIERQGAEDIYVPAQELEDVHFASGAAGKFVEKDGLLVLPWNFGSRPVESYFRTQFSADKESAHEQLTQLASQA